MHREGKEAYLLLLSLLVREGISVEMGNVERWRRAVTERDLSSAFKRWTFERSLFSELPRVLPTLAALLLRCQ